MCPAKVQPFPVLVHPYLCPREMHCAHVYKKHKSKRILKIESAFSITGEECSAMATHGIGHAIMFPQLVCARLKS